MNIILLVIGSRLQAQLSLKVALWRKFFQELLVYHWRFIINIHFD